MSTYPTSLDSFPTLASTDFEDDTGKFHDVVHNDEMDAILAIETYLGISGSAVSTTISYKVAALIAAVASLGTAAALDVDTDGTLSANSDTRIATQKAVKTAIAAAVTGLFDFQGSTNCSANPNYPAAFKGDAYAVSVAGKIGGASGASVDVGDVYVASADNAGGTQASVGTSWFILEHNLAGVLLAANNLSDLTSAATARTNLGLAAIAASGSAADLSTGTLPVARLPTYDGLDVMTVSGADIASASTTDLATTTGRNVMVTGTTTITALGTMASGIERITRFAGVLTLTHNATSLICITGANITTAAGDQCKWKSEGSGNWRMQWYTRADGTPLTGGGGGITLAQLRALAVTGVG